MGAAIPTIPVPRSRGCWRVHLNSLWSVWYGLCAAALQGYIAARAARRLLLRSEPPWPELHVCLALVASSAVLLPCFLVAALFKVGNLANDGFKLGRHLSACTADPPGPAAGGAGGGGIVRGLWRHGGPTAPFLHLAAAFCLLLPRLLLEARLVHAGLLPKEAIWRTDLDFMVVHHDRLVVLSFVTSPGGNATDLLPTPLPLASSTAAAAAAGGGGDEAPWGPVSAEFLNYALALLVYAVRYPAVFWNTNKGFGLLFSFQLLANGLQSLLSFAGMCVLYKVQVYGPAEALPLLPRRAESPLLLNTQVSLALYVLSSVLVLASSLVLYLYGYGRLTAFLNQERERRVIVLRERRRGGWGYFTHCAALCVLLAIALCNAPLLYDYTVVYRASLDGAVLACVIGGILHLFLWVVVWLLLTIKQRWTFKLRVTVGRAAVKSARSVKLVTDVDLASGRQGPDDAGAAVPLLVVGNGRTYTISEVSPKKAIMGVIQKAALDRKARAAQGGSGVSSMDEGDEQIYWLRPKPISPKTSPVTTSDRGTWLNRKLGGAKHKVTFDDSLNGPTNRSLCAYKKGKSLLARPGSRGKGKAQRGGLEQLSESEEDDGDYATLREIPPGENSEDTISEENKLLDTALQDDAVTYARTNRDLNPGDYEEPTPLVTPEPNDEELPPPPTPVAGPVTVHNSTAITEQNQLQSTATPRCLRRADSGMPHDELTPRSGSVSTESSASGGSPPCGNHSETSSGVHSNSSSDNHGQGRGEAATARRSTSVDDLTASLDPVARTQPQWRSCSLQRNVLPPTAVSLPRVVPKNGDSGGGSNPALVQPIYAFGAVHSQRYVSHIASPANCPVVPSGSTGDMGSHPAVLLESTAESTVVIRRKQPRAKDPDGAETPLVKDEPFGRSTNMRMTSFTDCPDGSRPGASSSATLPHYPTQPIAVATIYPHCSTMPLPSSGNVPVNHPATTGSGSCHSFPRPHTTIPTHHNGIRLFNGPNPFVKRFPIYHHHQALSNGRPPQVVVGPYGTMPVNATPGVDTVRSSSLTGHHTFPHMVAGMKYSPQHLSSKQDRDSANFSMASSGDSDQYLPHT
ncbi:protein tincar [Bacillus rossius redtenbacheri]|uniref:protein tincar n=1 Tax=Bacillus rossius redtenbacheri TaxID=93214 RepID=UPI002FDD08F3